ncbi:MAG TPA: flagellar biosynthetic protein FliO [Caulobacterales bacterium]|nr:flagellar biosynthetic protein FliO [Caulobacterales bacterium]
MSWIDWARAAAALALTLALLAGLAYGARRFGMLQGAAPGVRRMKVSESLMLDPRRRLVLVQVDGREHLLLLSPAGDRVVAAMDKIAMDKAGPEA